MYFVSINVEIGPVVLGNLKKKDVKRLPTGDRKQTTGDQKYSHDLSAQLIQNVYVLFAKVKYRDVYIHIYSYPTLKFHWLRQILYIATICFLTYLVFLI